MPKEIPESEGWYDTGGDFHTGDVPDYLLNDPDAWEPEQRLVVDFGEGNEHDYKTIFPADWEWEDWEGFLEDLQDWYDQEYGEATQ